MATLAILVLVLLFGGRALAQESWDAVIQAAKKEGKVVQYMTSGWEDALEEKGGIDLFHKKYGIKVETVVMRSREVRERVNTERRAKRIVADVAASGATSLSALWEEGGLEQWHPPSIKELRPEVAKSMDLPKVAITPIQVSLRGIFVNTRLIPAGKEPKCWRDLVDPVWRGKIMMDDPRSAGAGYSWFVTTLELPELGEAYHRKLAENKPFIVAAGGANEVETAVTNGQFGIGIPMDMDVILKPKAPTTKWIPACEGLSYSLNGIGLVKGAPHPNAGKLWIDFLLSKEMQQIFGQDRAPTRAGVASARKDWSLDHVKMIPRPLTETAEERNRNYRMAEKIYGLR